jgi:AraC-like DNA-binding protein
MFSSFVVYASHFLFFSGLTAIYYWIDPLYQFASLLVYPLYYIYFRLLMVDEHYTIKRHGLFLLTPTLLAILYLTGMLFIPSEVFKGWLIDRSAYGEVTGIRYMNVLSALIRAVFIIQVFYVLICNFWLIHKYQGKAKQYYSDIQDSRINNVLILNIILVITSFSSITLSALGKVFFAHELIGLSIASFIFSTMLFLIGWFGYRQKSINPCFETLSDDIPISEDELPAFNRQLILEKILLLFENDSIHLNSRLTILDVARTVGTNRTYISTIINQKFNQNFCKFVNAYRIETLEKLIRQHPEYTNHILSETCGFGSIDSMKRAVIQVAGISFGEWKNRIMAKR